jgi:uncharacterized protein (TIGR02145 family)
MNKQTTIILFLLLIGSSVVVRAQQGFGTNAPDPSSVVDMSATNKGVLLPRVALTGTNDVVTINAAPSYLMVFNTATTTAGTTQVRPGFYYKNTDWIRIQEDMSTWRLKGNTAIADAYFLGTTNAYDLGFQTNSMERMRIVRSPLSNIGIGTIAPSACAILELSSTTKGFLPPRMSENQMHSIASPATGLVVYNSTKNTLGCTVDGDVVPVFDDPTTGGAYTTHLNGWVNAVYQGSATTITHFVGQPFSDNTACVGKMVSVTGCGGASTVSGATGIVYPLIEINGQCWMAENSREIPSAFSTSPVWVNGADTGSWGYYNTATPDGSAGWGTTVPAAGEGLLYQWSAAMNGATAERSRGVCPVGFHIPSDCEFMYLEHGLGLTVAQQVVTGAATRSSGFLGTKLQKAGVSGFSALLTGCRSFNGAFYVRMNYGNRWTSSQVDNSTAFFREILGGNDQTGRGIDTKAVAYSVRCIKD